MRVLIGVDGSDSGFEAVRQAASLVAPERDPIALFYSPPAGAPRRGGAADSGERARQALATAVFEKGRAELPDPLRQRAEIILGTAPAHQGILAAADEYRADLIAVGARGLGPIQRLLLGSVSTRVARAARCPVLVARPRPPGPWNVLLAVEGLAGGRQLAPTLKSICWPDGTAGRVMSVIESFLAGEVPYWLANLARSQESQAMAEAWMREHQEDREAKRRELVELQQSLPPTFSAGEPLVAEGHPAEQILDAITREKVHLAVVGAQGKNAWQRYVLGSTSDALLTHAPCSVLIVHASASA